MQDDADKKQSAKQNSWATVLIIFAAFIAGVAFTMGQINADLAARKPPMPVSIAFRQAMIGDGLVAGFTNNSNEFLSLKVTMKNPTFNKAAETRLDVGPGEKKEIGHLEGWTFASGDEIVVSNNNFEPLSTITP